MKLPAFLIIHLFIICSFSVSGQKISHGPMLGAVTENSAKIWFRTDVPCIASLEIRNDKSLIFKTKIKTESAKDNTAIAEVSGLSPGTSYKYIIITPKETTENTFCTNCKTLRDSVIRIAYGCCYVPELDNPGENSIFNKMRLIDLNAIFFIGDFPYSRQGEKTDIENGHRIIRKQPGFRELTCSTPTYGIYDDHDFGPNDCDGTNPYAREAYAAFREYWANPTYGINNEGGYTLISLGEADFFMMDGRYFSRQDTAHGTVLGKEQFSWLCKGLLESKAKYKVLISGAAFVWDKDDCWGSIFYKHERDSLFNFIASKNIKGVFAISGDSHRCDICKFRLNNNHYFYDFTTGALAQNQRFPRDIWPKEMIYSYGNNDNNMFSVIEFYPSGEYAVIFKSYSAKNGMLHQVRLTKEELGY